MAVSVRLNSGVQLDPIVHEEATKWTVEKDTRSLVLMTDDNHAVALYGPDKWMSTEVVGEYDSDETIAKVYEALEADGAIGHTQAINAMNRLQNAGILFRERALK